jgi:hypothetical protein
MKRIASVSWSGLAVLALVAALPGDRAEAQKPKWDRTISVEVRAPDHKPNGKTWDLEIPVMISVAMPTMGDPAPDMMLCVVDESGAEDCIHNTTRNRFGVPYSICPNAYVCNFANVKVPSTGHFGFLIIDLDELPNQQDYMLGAVLRYGPKDAKRAWKVEEKLRALAMKWHAVGVPDGFPQSEVADCSLKNPCFGDSRGGIPSVSISEAEIDECGMPIRGELSFGPGEAPGAVGFHLRMIENKCPGTSEFAWRYGDGTTEITRQPQSAHSFGRPGDFTVSVVTRCVRRTGTCETAPESTKVTIER